MKKLLVFTLVFMLFPLTVWADCAPPNYCARTDFKTAQVPSPVPNVGNLTGANTVVVDPDFNHRILRVTDAKTDPAGPDSAYITTASGFATENIWNTDSTLFLISDTKGAAYPFTFDPQTFRASRMYVSSFPSTRGMKLPNGGFWSRVNPNILYILTGTTIEKYDFTDRFTPPTPELVYDFTSSPNCLPAGFQVTWYSPGGVSADDSVIVLGISGSGAQGTGHQMLAYKVGSGCRIYNTATGQVTGDWGPTGTINIPDRYKLHAAQMSQDGKWALCGPSACMANCSETASPYFWDIGTTMVNVPKRRLGGHWVSGFSHWVNNDQNHIADQTKRPFFDPSSISSLIQDYPTGMEFPLDQHPSWYNDDPSDSTPFFTATWSTLRPFPAAWYNEVLGITSDGSGIVWRFAHTFITAKSQTFDTRYAIGTVSQDGRYFLLSSDWMGTLGSVNGSRTCKVGTNCRGDVFIVELSSEAGSQ
jgi:hypothetical protein